MLTEPGSFLEMCIRDRYNIDSKKASSYKYRKGGTHGRNGNFRERVKVTYEFY